MRFLPFFCCYVFYLSCFLSPFSSFISFLLSTLKFAGWIRYCSLQDRGAGYFPGRQTSATSWGHGPRVRSVQILLRNYNVSLSGEPILSKVNFTQVCTIYTSFVIIFLKQYLVGSYVSHGCVIFKQLYKSAEDWWNLPCCNFSLGFICQTTVIFLKEWEMEVFYSIV